MPKVWREDMEMSVITKPGPLDSLRDLGRDRSVAADLPSELAVMLAINSKQKIVPLIDSAA